MLFACPEQYGAIADGSTDCLAAFNACVKEHRVLSLGVGIYRISDTFKPPANTRIIGAQKSYGGGGTIIAIDHPTAPAVYLGDPIIQTPDLQLSDLTLKRLPRLGAGSITLRIQNCLFCDVRDVFVWDAQRAVFLCGNIRAELRNVHGLRNMPAADLADDFFEGFFLDGDSSLAAAGGNASTLLQDCTGAVNQALSIPSAAINIQRAGADTFVRGGEATGTSYGVIITGSAGHPKERSGDADIQVQGFRCDQFTLHGILVQNTGLFTSIDISHNYFAPRSSDSRAPIGMTLSNTLGMILLDGNEVIGWPNANTCGLRVDSCTGVRAVGNRLLECARPEEWNASSIVHSENLIHNPTMNSAQAAVLLTGNTNRGVFSPMITGKRDAFAAGISLEGHGGESFNDLHCSKIHPHAVRDGRKLTRNSERILIPGPFASDNVAYGQMQ